MHFGEFNPLDVLAAAASLHSPGHGEGADESQSSDGEGDGEEGTEDGIGACNYSQTSSLGCGLNTSDSVAERTFSDIVENPHCATFVDTVKSAVESTDREVMPRVVKVLSNNGRLTEKLDADDKLVCSPKETCTMTGTTTTGAKDCATKTVTILRVKKTQNVDHSYAVYSKLEKSRMEDDEGYCSRSSLGSPGQCWKSDSEMMDPDILDGRDSECGPKSPYLVLPTGQSVKSPDALSPHPSADHGDGSITGLKSPAMPEVQVNTSDVTVVDGQNRSSPSNKKCTKIVIVSRDANLRKYFSSGDMEPSMAEQQNNSAFKHRTTETSESKTKNHKDETVATQGMSASTANTGTSAKGDRESKTCQEVPRVNNKKDLMEDSLRKGSLSVVLSEVNNGHQSDVSEADADDIGKSDKLHPERGCLETGTDMSESDVNGTNFKKSDSLEAGSFTASQEVLSDEVRETVNVSMDKQDNSHLPAVSNVLLKSEHKQGSGGELDEKNMMTPVTPISDGSTGHSTVPRSLPVVESGSAVLPNDELKMQRNEVRHGLSGSGSEKDKDSPSTSDILTAVSSVPNKAGLVCIMSTTASDVVSNPAVMSPNQLCGAKVSSPNQCNKYIIQDDVPPVSKYGEATVQNSKTDTFASLLAPTCKTLEPNTKQCSTKPRFVTGSKESFVLLRLSNLSTKSPKSGLVTFSPSVKSPVPTSCVVPVLVNTGSSLPHSLLSSPAKNSSTGVSGTQANICITPAGNTKSAKLASPSLSSCLLKKTESSPKEDTTSVATAAIPRSWSSLLSSHKLLSGSSLISMQPLVASQESGLDKNHDSLDSSVKTLTAPDGDENHTSSVCDTAENVKPHLDRSALLDPALSSVSCLGQKPASYEGRLTPLGFAAAAADSNGGSTGNINIKISGGVVVDVQQEKGIRDLKNKSTCSIGQVGSLTWQNVNQPAMDTAARFLPVRHGRTMLTGTMKKDGLSDALLVELKKKHPKSRAGMPSRAELYRMKESAQNISELHPLIDHDYCMFTEFSADIQSSIIATMDTKIKPERRSVKKAKVARTKLYQTPATQTKVDPKLKKRKYTKRKLNQLLQRVKGVMGEVSGQNDGTDEKQTSVANNAPGSVFMSGQLKEKFRDRKPKRHYRPRNSGDKNYVKIPGSYQDEFVYYATKKQRGRPRKFEEEHQETAAKSAATSINEFEWYQEMAKIDKGSKFGVAGVGTNNITKPNNLELLHKMPDYGHGANGSTPIQESDVVDMVIDMMPSSGLDVSPPMDSSNIFGVLMNNDVGHRENIPSDGHSEDSSASRLDVPGSSSEQTSESTVDPGVMAEFNRLLNSMEEAEQLKILVNLTDGQASGEKQDKDSNGLCKTDGDGMLNNLNAYLGSYSTDGHNAGSSLTVGQSQTQFLDLDEINDNDLLNTSELGNIFADLTTASTTSTTSSLAVMTTAGDGLQKMADSEFANFADSSCSSYSMESGTVDLPNVDSQLPPADPPLTLGTVPSAFGRPLDKCELFPDISSTVPQVSSEFGVPDLTLVNMYWNELPGLLINGKEYVRLVDIHKQVLPAKDTGILKKRCQMMGLDIMNCSELQRDFLIRYMNAAKSKSCVIVAKEAAKTLIGFYVDPRPRMLNKPPAEPYIPTTKPRTGPSKLKVLLPSRRESKVNISADDELATSDSVTSASSSTSTTNSPAVASRTGKQKSRHVNATEDPSDPGAFVNSRRRHEVSAKDIKRSPRLRNKKVMYAALHNGGWAEEEEPPRTLSPNVKGSSSDVNDSDAELKVNVHPEENVNVLEVPETDLKTTALKSKHLSSADDIKLSELVARQVDCKLNLKERRRINRLQKKIRKHKLLSCHDEVELLEKWLRNLEKAKLRRLKKKAIADKYSLEHCYAANPEPQDQSIKGVKLETGGDVCGSGDTTEVKHQEETSVPNKHSPAVRISDQSPGNKTTKNSGTVPAESKSKSRLKMARLGNGEIQQTLQVVHMDSVQRSHGKRNHSQAGTLYMSKYQSREAACIECNTCREMLSVRRFLKHRHHLNNPDELVEVSLPQKLELSPPPQADMRSDDVHLWAQFTQRRQTFSQLLPKRRHTSKVRASVKHRPVVHRIRNASRKHLEPALNKNVVNAENNNDTCKQDIVQNASDVVSEAAPETLDDSSRHSGRVRKRKQLYPMESYVFGRSARQGSPVTKRARYGVDLHGSPT